MMKDQRPDGRNHPPRAKQTQRQRPKAKASTDDESIYRKILSSNLQLENFVILDIETTGGNPEKNCFTEIFAEKIDDSGHPAVFHSLVNPKMSIPPIVRRMTGITNAMVKDAPTIDEVMPKFLDFIAGKIVVSHNAQGDLKFLEHYTRTTTGRDFKNFYICTHILAEKLFPQAPAKSLKGLAKFFEIESGRLHRAEADVVITKAIFLKELEALSHLKESPQTIEQLIRFQGDLSSLMRLGWSVDPKKINSLPAYPGVATLYDEERRVLHITASQHLLRDFSRFPAHEQLPKALVKLSLRAHDLDFERCFTMFEALMRECDLLDQHPQIAHPAVMLQRIAYGFHCSYDRKSQQYVLGIRSVGEDTLWVFGPIFNHKEGHEILRDIGQILNTPLKKDGLHLKKEQAQLVHAVFAQMTFEGQENQKKNWLQKLAFWKKASSGEENFQKLTKLLQHTTLTSLLHLSGILTVPLEGSGRSAFYLISHSLPTRRYEFRSESVEDFLFEMDYKRLRKSLETGDSHQDGIQSQKNARLINSFLWWHFYSPHKKEGRFLTLSVLDSMMVNGGKSQR